MSSIYYLQVIYLVSFFHWSLEIFQLLLYYKIVMDSKEQQECKSLQAWSLRKVRKGGSFDYFCSC